MSQANDLPTISDNESSTCPIGGCKCQHGLLRAAVYLPAILILSGMAAVAMFPDLADYGYPLIGKPSHTGFKGAGECPGGLCPSPLAVSRSIEPVKPASSDDSAIPSCCAEPVSRARSFCCPVSAEASSSESTTKQGEDRSLTNPATQDRRSAEDAPEENPADATAVLSALPSEAESN